MLMEALSIGDYVPPAFERITPPVRTGYLHGSLGNVEGYSPELPAEYEDRICMLKKVYAQGSGWQQAMRLNSMGISNRVCVLRYSGNSVKCCHVVEQAWISCPGSSQRQAITTSESGETSQPTKRRNSVVVLK